MGKINWLIIFVFTSGVAAAQQDSNILKRKIIDSVKAERLDQAALLYPRIRQFSISHQEGMTGDIHSKLNGNDLASGRIRMSRTVINMNVPVVDKVNNSLITSLGVVHQFFSTSSMVRYDKQTTIPDTTRYIPMVSLGLTYVHRDTVFGHPVMITGSVSGLFNPAMSRRQFSFTGVISFPVIRRENTSLTAGLAVIIDPSTPVPAFPFLSYYHKFRALDMDLMIDVPYRVALRKPMFKRASLTAFGEMAGSNSFFDLNSSVLPEKLTYSQFEVKSGLLFEYRATKKAVVSLSGGLQSVLTSKIMEQGSSPNSYLIKNKMGTVPYVQVGISMLPFWRPFR